MTFSFLSKWYTRNVCDCGIAYWTNHANKCGECYTLIPHRDGKKYTSSTLKQKYLNYFKSLNYKVIKDRHLRLSRNNINFVNAGICVYTPHFLKGKTSFKSQNQFVNMQSCVRFDDYENVGVTNRHLTCFTMCGQHIFETTEFKFTENWKEKYFTELFNFFLSFEPNLNLYIINESTWTDHINKGYSLEIFLDNIEIANQVYTTESVNGELLEFKYIDMGMGFERLCLVLNKKESLLDLYNITANSLILKDHMNTINKAYTSGLYFSKKNVGYNLRLLIERLFKLFSIHSLLKLSNSEILKEHILDEYHRWKKN